MNILDQVAHIPDGVTTVKLWLGEGAIPVAKEKSHARAQICLSCPHNIQGNFFNDAISAAIKKVVKIKNGLNLRCEGESKLGACEICTCSTRIKVHVDIGVIRRSMTTEDLSKFPDFCWQVTEKP